MRKGLRILVAVLAIGVAAGLVVRTLPPSEPSWKGKKLSAWMHEFSGFDPALESATMEAVRGMGTNVIPYVRAELYHHDTPLRLKLIHLGRKQRLLNLHLRTAAELHDEACMIYSFTEAPVKGPLVSDWINFVAREPNELDSALMSHGGRGEQSLGAEAFPALMQGLESTNDRVRLLAVVWLKYIPNYTERVVPALVQKLVDANLEVRGAAALSLGYLKQEPRTAVPALLHGLNDPEAIMRHRCVRALGCFTNEAPSVVPSLQKALEDPDRIVRREAEQVLKRLVPEACTTVHIE